MRRWDRLQDSYMEEYRARGVSTLTISYTESRLDRWGRWLKKRRPRVGMEHIDADTITRYIEACASFRSKSTAYGMLSTMRGFGDYLVRQGLWKINPLRWMKGPKVSPYSRLPKRIDQAHMEALWRAAAHRGGEYSSHLWVTTLALLYGTGLRRGELARLNVGAFDRNEGTLRIDGRKTGQERCVPLPEMVLRCLEAYLPLRHNQLEQVGLIQETALLVSRYGQRLSGSAISNGIHDIAHLAQVPIHSRVNATSVHFSSDGGKTFSTGSWVDNSNETKFTQQTGALAGFRFDFSQPGKGQSFSGTSQRTPISRS